MFDVQEVSVSFQGNMILHNLSFRIRSGETLTVVGPNGAGKSTLLKVFLRIYPPQSGRITVHEHPLSSLSRKELARLVGYVPQNLNQELPFTVKQFLEFSHYPYSDQNGSILRDRIHRPIQMTGIESILNRRMETLSGGELRKAYVAGALAQNTDVLLLDEPTTFLDPQYKGEILDIFTRLNEEEDRTVVIVTHDLNEVVKRGDRVLGLKEGEKQVLCQTDQFFEKDVLKRMYGVSFQCQDVPGRKVPFVSIGHP